MSKQANKLIDSFTAQIFMGCLVDLLLFLARGLSCEQSRQGPSSHDLTSLWGGQQVKYANKYMGRFPAPMKIRQETKVTPWSTEKPGEMTPMMLFQQVLQILIFTYPSLEVTRRYSL
jgi:hypothetical protein